MNYSDIQIVMQEVPGEISISFTITGCNLRCEGCHSSYLWKEDSGQRLTKKIFLDTLIKYRGFASCVLFMGGEWHTPELTQFLVMANDLGYKTCLYTGQDIGDLSTQILSQLTWLKYGAWKQELGGLKNPETNQKFIDVKNNKLLNNLFKN